MSLLGFLRRRRRLLPHYVQDSPETWVPGDIALCTRQLCWVHAGSCTVSTGPENGEMNRVTAVTLLEGRQFLRFVKWDAWYAACTFVKAKPDAAEACSADFLRQVHEAKPKVLV